MTFRNIALATAALSLAASPALAQTSFERTVAPVEGESEVAGGSTLLIALLAAAAVIAGVIVIADDDDDSVSAG